MKGPHHLAIPIFSAMLTDLVPRHPRLGFTYGPCLALSVCRLYVIPCCKLI